MEKTMSKTSHASNGALEDHGALEDTELDAVTGGKLIDTATPKLLEAALKGHVFKKVEIHGTA
jgi:type VI protein secretion system component Hcp